MQQIKSLFSRWAKKYKKGSLKEPVETSMQNNESNQPVDEEELNNKHNYDIDDGKNVDNNNQDDKNEYGIALQEQVNIML